MGAAMLAESAEIGQYDDLTGMLAQAAGRTVAALCMCEDGFDPYRWGTMAGMRSETVPKSRTQLKKEANALQRLGEKLIALSDDQLARMELPALLIEAIQAIRTMRSHGAQRRQIFGKGWIDPCSSGPWFDGWRQAIAPPPGRPVMGPA